MDRRQFGLRIRDLRKRAGLTQAGLAGRVNMTSQAVGHWEKGRSLPQATELRELADALGVRVCALYGVEEGHEQEQAPSADWARRLVEGLAQHPDRIEINLYREGGYRAGTGASEHTPAHEGIEPLTGTGLRFMRAFLAEGKWREMPETERNQWRELAEAIRREEGAANGPDSRRHGRGYP